MRADQIRPGVVVRHHSGRVYTILGLLNASVAPTDEFPHMVEYIGANGNKWTRPAAVFAAKYKVLYDGSTLAPDPI